MEFPEMEDRILKREDIENIVMKSESNIMKDI